MKKTLIAKPGQAEAPEILPEYNFDYSKARRNRFAGKISEERLVVLLDRKVSEVFTTPEAVNSVLKALVAALPKVARQKTARKDKRT